MNCLAIGIDYSSGLPLIAAAGIAMYIASKAICDALVGHRTGMPGRLAIGQWIPIAMLTIAAVITHRQPLAMGLIFSTSVACLSLGTGAVGFLGVTLIAPASRKSWAMLVPVGLLTFLAGFRASLSLPTAGILALQGLCVLLLWVERNDAAKNEMLIPPAGRGWSFRIAQLMLGLILAAQGCYFAINGIDNAATGSDFATSGLLAATLISPLLVLPIIGTGAELSQRNQAATAISSQVGVALLNSCLLLPLIVVLDAGRQIAIRIHDKLDFSAGHSIDLNQIVHAAHGSFQIANLSGFPFPLDVWRVDLIVFIALGLFLLPVAIGKWSIGKAQGFGLMLGYAFYLALVVMWRQFTLYGVPLKSSP